MFTLFRSCQITKNHSHCISKRIIMESASWANYPINTQYFQKIPDNFKVSVSTDIGNDPDDAFAWDLLLRSMHEGLMPKRSLKEIVTTLYKPEEKALIAAKINEIVGDPKIRFYTGYGCSPESPEEFSSTYPFWNHNWGIPGFTNQVSLGQAKAFENLPSGGHKILSDGASAIAASAKKYGDKHIILGIAPHTDLVPALESSERVNRIILMGGYFGKEDANELIQISRPGYNTALDLEASERILTQNTHPVLIFNSQHITNWKFAWSQEEILAIIRSPEKTLLGTALAKDMAYYWSNKKPSPYGSLTMADVLTVYAGIIQPQLVKSTMPVEFEFHSKYYTNQSDDRIEPIHMMHPQAHTLFSVRKKEYSNIHIVTELSIDPQILRQEVVEKIALSHFFQNKQQFDEAVVFEKQNPLSNEEIGTLASNFLTP